MEYYRVLESRFHLICDYPFESNYIDVEGLRIHYIDEGPRTSKPILLLHGVPTWSFLYRDIIPELSAAGYRVLAPDLAGFGKSDKPADPSWHSLSAHVRIIKSIISVLDLQEITLFGQDWGSMIGLRVAVEEADRFAGIIISNGGLPGRQEKIPVAFIIWRMFARFSPWFPIDRIVNLGCLTRLPKNARKAYRAPFPGSKYKIGPRILPRRVPLSVKNPDTELNRKAWELLSKWNKPFLTVFGDADPITRAWGKKLRLEIPGAKGQDHRVLRAGHFIQDDAGPELAEIIINFVGRLDEQENTI